jgi:hypothetical protein
MVTNVPNEYITSTSYPEDGGDMFFRNVSNYISDDTELHLRRTMPVIKNVVLTWNIIPWGLKHVR